MATKIPRRCRMWGKAITPLAAPVWGLDGPVSAQHSTRYTHMRTWSTPSHGHLHSTLAETHGASFTCQSDSATHPATQEESGLATYAQKHTY